MGQPRAKISLSLHQLVVEVEHETVYPDQLTDMANRAFSLFHSALQSAQEQQIDIRMTLDEIDIHEDDF
jgi:hypothetical protein